MSVLNLVGVVQQVGILPVKSVATTRVATFVLLIVSFLNRRMVQMRLSLKAFVPFLTRILPVELAACDMQKLHTRAM